MLNRRVFLGSTMALVALVQGCNPSIQSAIESPSARGPWRGKWIDVYSDEGVAMNWQQDKAEVVVRGHRIVIREASISLDDETKAVQTFKRVAIHVKPDIVSVTVDGTDLFT